MTNPAKKSAPPIKPLPTDVLALVRDKFKHASGTELAAELGVSPSAISQAVHDKFRGNVERFAARVRGVWGGDTVLCPVLGDINTKVCLDQQGRPVIHTNPMRVSLARACKTCPHKQAPTSGGKDHE